VTYIGCPIEIVYIKRGLRALEDREFLMPSNTIGIARTHKELSVEMVKTVPPWEVKI